MRLEPLYRIRFAYPEACVGEVRAPADPNQEGPDLVLDVAELVWEPIAD